MKPLLEEDYLILIDKQEINKVMFNNQELSKINNSLNLCLKNKELNSFKINRKDNEILYTINDSTIEILKYGSNCLVEIVSSDNGGCYTFYYLFKNVKNVISDMSDLTSHVI
jgi:hypothetical protein